jgi:UrcA family protein
MTYQKFVFAFAAVTITAASFAAVSTPASSKTPIMVVADPDIVTRRISYTDLNLASAAGERTLNRRVGNGIDSLCLEATGDDGRYWSPNYMLCRSSAWRQARPQMANARQRARDIALTGTSTIAAAAITIDLSR